MDLTGKIVTVLGAGKSGQAAAALGLAKGAKVKVSEKAVEDQLTPALREWIEQNKIRLETGGHTKDFIEQSDFLIVSPGINLNCDAVKWARGKGVTVWSEIEFAYRFCPVPIIAITGSNGKTTVSHLTARVLTEAGYHVHLCGNIGWPFSEAVLDLRGIDFIVLEVSSFQLELISAFCPKIAVLTNVSQNHLDRHANLEEYFQIKQRMFMNQSQADFAVINAGDPLSQRIQGLTPKVFYFNSEEQQRKESGLNQNQWAVAQVCRVLNIAPDIYRKIFSEFRGVEHRMEKLGLLRGVEFINDSKSTTAQATAWALANISCPVLLICGGRDKNIDFSTIQDIVRQKVKTMIVIGEAKEKIKQCFHHLVPVRECETLEDALATAYQNSQAGDCILLSPMCASYDMFKNFEERGSRFKQLVEMLKEKFEQGGLCEASSKDLKKSK